MLVVNGMIKSVPTVFVGLNVADVRRVFDRQPIAIPTAIDFPAPRIECQIILLGGETDDDLHEQIVQLGSTIFEADEDSRN